MPIRYEYDEDYDRYNLRGFGGYRTEVPERGYSRGREYGQSNYPGRYYEEDWPRYRYPRYGRVYNREPYWSGYEDYDLDYGRFETSRRPQTESWRTVGPHTGRGPKGYQRSDERIKEDVSEQLWQHGQLDATEIDVNVSNGEVTLTGTVDSRGSKRLAEDVAESVAGVKDVHNQLRIKQEQLSAQPRIATAR